MLKETSVSQKEEGVFRRWFEDDYFRLIVWYKAGTDEIIGFQLLYDICSDEHSFTWHETAEFFHNKIDDERNINKYPSSPILVNDGQFNYKAILSKFKSSSKDIDKKIILLVEEKIIEYSNFD